MAPLSTLSGLSVQNVHIGIEKKQRKISLGGGLFSLSSQIHQTTHVQLMLHHFIMGTRHFKGAVWSDVDNF